MQIPAQKTPWFQREGVQLANRVGMRLQDSDTEALFFNLSTLGNPGITVNIVGATPKTIASDDYIVLHCQEVLPLSQGPAMIFPVLIPLQVKSPVEKIENMEITKKRQHPFVSFLMNILSL